MTDSKWALQSKTILGALLAMLVVILPTMGISFTADDSALFSALLDKILEVGGLALAIWGRFTASSDVTVLPK